MDFKSDTKEKFHVITLKEPVLSATMTGELAAFLLSYLETVPHNLVLSFDEVKELDLAAAEKLVTVQQKFYEQDASFVVCALQKQVEEFLDQNDLLEMMNATPTISEAGDIVQMEEIEREMLDEE